MSFIESIFQQSPATGKLIVYLTAGDPDYERSKAVIQTVISAGADIIELGIPFSDPLADGPVIQAASHRALSAGMTVAKTLKLTDELKSKTNIPIIAMTYSNPILRYGLKQFAHDAANAGINGTLLTDLPPDEAEQWIDISKQNGLDTIFLLAPTSTEERIQFVAERSTGFIYCVSRTGVTGTQASVPSEVNQLVNRVRQASSKPIAVGFGISKPEHVKEVCQIADGAIVGSAVVRFADEQMNEPNFHRLLGEWISELKAATKH